jgi:DNA repair protein RadC
MKAQSEDRAEYAVSKTHDGDEIIRQALAIIGDRMRSLGDLMTSPQLVSSYLTLTLAERKAESFWCIWLDCKNRMISVEEMFTGTLTQTSVYPREVLRSAIAHNAASVIFAHNHPSGSCEPSKADEMLTNNLKTVLAMIDCKVLDHFIVAGTTILSFAERGLI